jgi:hypothetical protein
MVPWGSCFADGLSPGDSGLRALNLADILGADPIYLLGIDLRGNPKAQQWWHEGYDMKSLGTYEEFLRVWVDSAPLIKASVINLSTESALEAFPKMKWNEVL